MLHEMKSKWTMAVAVGVSLGLSSLARGAVYTGELKYEETHPQNEVLHDSFIAKAANANNTWRQSSILTWTVSNEEPNNPAGYDWYYEYTLEVHKFIPVAWMIETGAGFSQANLTDVEVSGNFVNQDWTYSLGTWEKEGDSQGDFLREMPEARYGILFQNLSEGGESTDGSITVSFWSNQAPMWGDLYANCGGNGNRGWNQGFTADNPTAAAASGTIDNHVLVPIPEPSMLALLLIGGGLALSRRRI